MSNKRTQAEILTAVEGLLVQQNALLTAIVTHFGVLGTVARHLPPVAEPDGDPVPEETPEESTVDPQESTVEDTEEEQEELELETPEALTATDLEAILVGIATEDSKKVQGIHDIIAEFGGKSINEVDPQHYPAIAEKARAL